MTKLYKGFVVVGKRGNIIAFLFDDDKNQGSGKLVKLGFTTEEARTTNDRVFRAELTYNKTPKE